MTSPQVDEADDFAHYYFADWEPFEHRGSTSYRISFFPEQSIPHSGVDLRDPGDIAGVALVRTALSPEEIGYLPPNVFYVGHSLTASMPPDRRTEVRRRLKVRGQITNVKDVLRFMLLTEANEAGKPGALQPEPDGGLYVYLGDLRVDLSDAAG